MGIIMLSRPRRWGSAGALDRIRLRCARAELGVRVWCVAAEDGPVSGEIAWSCWGVYSPRTTAPRKATDQDLTLRESLYGSFVAARCARTHARDPPRDSKIPAVVLRSARVGC